MGKRYHVIISSVVILLFISCAVMFSGQSEKATYIGAGKCKMCHMKQYKSWEKTKHAKAFEVLKAKGQDKNPDCIKCHVTGLGKEGGFKNIDETPDMINVQCETCHGPGSEHKEAPKEEKKDKISKVVVCTQCHNPHMSAEEMMEEGNK